MVRSDAVENRARILQAAREAFAEDGATSMNQVAQRAGVGAGTLYRNFPTREALALAVYQDEIDRILGTVPTLLADNTPREALRLWTLDLVEAMRRKQGLGDALSPGAHQAMTEQTYGPVVGAIAELLKADQSDFDPGDYLALTAALWRAPAERTPRMLDLILAGLQY